MTCSRNFDRVLQATCLGLVGMLAVAGCGGSSNNPDAKPSTGGDGAQQPDALPAASLKVAPPSVNFGSIDVGASSPASVVTVTNTGGLVVVSPTVTGAGFLIDSTTCGTPTASCTVSVKFSPATVGASSGILTIATGLTVSLSGTGTPPGTFTLTPSVIPTTVLVNQSLPVSVTVTATTALTDLSCLASGGDLTADATTTTCTGTIAANTPCVYAYTFKAATAGQKSDSIVCSSGGAVKTVPVAPTVVTGPSLAITPNPGSFSGSVGQTSAAITFNVANIGGSVSGALTTAPLSGANAGDFAIASNNCVVPLAPLTTCAIQVVFKPTAVGARTATLTVTDATAGSTPATTVLNGTAIAGSALAITGAANLGTVSVGQAGTALTYTITNSGGTPTGALAVAAGAQFAIGSDLCSGLPLAAAKTCTFTVTFSPTSGGVQSAVLSASSGGTTLAQLQVQGTGVLVVPPALTMSPATLDFGTIGVGTVSGTKTFTVTNTGAGATAVLSVVKKDSTSSVGGASQFGYTTTCQAALDPAASCQVVVTFSPTIAGSASATISVTDGVVTTPPASGTVVGIALSRPGITIDCANGNTFDPTVVGKTSLPTVCTVSNDSSSSQATGALTAATTGEFAVATNNCTASLAPGLSCTLSLTFSPTAKGPRTGTITVTGANGGATNANLTGTGLGVVEIVEYAGNCTLGVGHAVLCTPSVAQVQPYDFGQTTVGTNSTTTLTLAVFVRASVGNLSDTTAFGTPEEFTIVSNGCTPYASVAPTAPFSMTVPLCYIFVQHKPVSRAVANGTVTVAGASGDKDSATMKGTGAGPLTISPSPATFSNVATGTASNTLILTVMNNGTVSINGAAFTLTGANANQFSVVVDNLTGANIGPGGSATIGVRFIPTAVGAAAATLTVTGTRGDNSAVETATDSLVGNGATGAAMTVTISSNGAFADTYAGATSAPLTVTVANATGSLPTGMVTFVLTSPDFTTIPPVTTPPTLQGTCAGATTNPVNGGASCTEFVWFRPVATSALVARSATLTVTASPGVTVPLALTGNALPQLSIAPAGPAATPINVGTAVLDTETKPSVTFTLTNHAETAIPSGALNVVVGDSPNFPNMRTLFVVDPLATNTCNGSGAGAIAAGGTCVFKLTAIATSPTHAVTSADLGDFFGEVQAITGVQMAKADVKATIVTPASLDFTPGTCKNQPTRDIGVVALGGTSAPVKCTVINNGGTNSSAISAALYATGGTTAQDKARFAVDATGCTSLGETGLAPGATCDLLVTFHPTVTAPSDGGLTKTADLSVKATSGTGTLPGTQLLITFQGTATAASTSPYIVDDATGTAPSDMGAASGLVFTKTVALHAGSVDDTYGAIAGAASVSSPVLIAGESVVVGAGDTSGCTAGGATLAAAGKCTLKVVYTTVATTASGWHTFTVTLGGATIKMFAMVPAKADLLASRTDLNFGLVRVGANSQQITVVVTNVGQSATTGNIKVTVSDTTKVKTSGCAAAPLGVNPAGSCTLTIWVVPGATGTDTGTVSVTDSATVPAATDVINLSWRGTLAAGLTLTGAETDFGSQAVLSSAANTLTFTVSNGANSEKTGPLAISVLSGAAIVPDFVITGGTCITTVAALGIDLLAATPVGPCTVIAQFTPTVLAPATKTGTLTVTASPGGTATLDITGTAVSALTVTGPAGIVTATDGSKSFALANTSVAGGSTPVLVTFTNATGAPKTGLLTATLSGTDAAQFRVTNDGCTGTQVAGGATCSVALVFDPSTTGAKTATLTLAGSPGNSAALALNGTAIP